MTRFRPRSYRAHGSLFSIAWAPSSPDAASRRLALRRGA